MKNNIAGHLTIRLIIPFFILFLIWEIGGLENGTFEEYLFFSIFSSILIFAIIIFLLKETLTSHQDKNRIIRNLNIVLLLLFIPLFIFMVIASVAIINY
jgi:heme/copper-type cytochrome/quinol oxidase subunit 2